MECDSIWRAFGARLESHFSHTAVQPRIGRNKTELHLPPRPHSEQVIRSSLGDSFMQIPQTAVSLLAVGRSVDADSLTAFIDGDGWLVLFD